MNNIEVDMQLNENKQVMILLLATRNFIVLRGHKVLVKYTITGQLPHTHYGKSGLCIICNTTTLQRIKVRGELEAS
jgi:hypothetical protein